MAVETYTNINFSASSVDLIDVMNAIIENYQAQGFTLTVRQLYYQLVAKDVLPNTERSYKKVTGLVNDARMAGLIDWDAIEDRTRSFIRRTRWQSPQQILQAAADSYHMDLWENQGTRVYVIIEKEALVGVLQQTCQALDVPILAARGYPSVTVLREFAKDDLLPNRKQNALILHLGDHDPSGLDMTRDLEDRLNTFTYHDGVIQMKRIALNMDQIDEQKPPPNPAKTTDSRFAAYLDRFGAESWELDALSPSYLSNLVQGEILEVIDEGAWDERKEEIKAIKARIVELGRKFK